MHPTVSLGRNLVSSGFRASRSRRRSHCGQSVAHQKVLLAIDILLSSVSADDDVERQFAFLDARDRLRRRARLSRRYDVREPGSIDMRKASGGGAMAGSLRVHTCSSPDVGRVSSQCGKTMRFAFATRAFVPRLAGDSRGVGPARRPRDTSRNTVSGRHRSLLCRQNVRRHGLANDRPPPVVANGRCAMLMAR